MPGIIKRLRKPTLFAGALVAAIALSFGSSKAEAGGCYGYGYGGGWGYAPPVVVARPVVPVHYGYRGVYGPRRGFGGYGGVYGAGYRGFGYGGRGISIGFGF